MTTGLFCQKTELYYRECDCPECAKAVESEQLWEKRQEISRFVSDAISDIRSNACALCGDVWDGSYCESVAAHQTPGRERYFIVRVIGPEQIGELLEARIREAYAERVVVVTRPEDFYDDWDC